MGADGVERPSLRLPAGTVTFLLTDVEGSTRLWESAASAMRAAIARHYELLDVLIGCHGGVRPVEQGEGDSVVAAFARASDAVGAALDIQRAFHREPWPDGASLRVRIALYTGEAQQRDEGNYFGLAVNRCARLRAIAHGGQVVMSRVTRELALDRLPEGVELVDLGVHRLRDLGRPEKVFGLVHPELPAGFPPLRSLQAMPTNLPSELSSFVGRRGELTHIGQLLGQSRLLTLTGAGGCGKTRLALQAAADAVDSYSDGVWWVELARVENATLVAVAVISALGLQQAPDRPLAQTLVQYLRDRHVLLVLDNCEHLVEACARLVDVLLRGCATLTILATSRAPLRVPGEVTWRVPSMSLPVEHTAAPIESLRQFDAVSLFIDRAKQVRPSFAVTADNAPAIAQICHDLDGIPLAIELAAARVRMMAPEQICRALHDRFRLLTGGPRTVMPRQQTLEASLDWSHDLLSEHERVLLRRLAIFAGGWALEAAEHVCSGVDIDGYAVLDLLATLVDKSLVTTEEHATETRYRLLETVRHYAMARLAEAGEHDHRRNRHLTYYLAFAERRAPQILSAGPDNPIMDVLATELPNLRAALEWATATDPSAGLRVMHALTLFWAFTGRYQEAEAAYARVLDAAGKTPTMLRGRVLADRGLLGHYSGNKNALGWCQAALEIGQACDDAWTQGRALTVLWYTASFHDPARGRPPLQRSIQLATQAGDNWIRIHAAQMLALTWLSQDDFDAARPILQDAYTTATQLGCWVIIAAHWFAMGWEAMIYGRLNQARELFSQAAAPCEQMGEQFVTAVTNTFLTHVHLMCGETERAYALASVTLQRAQQAGAGMVLGMAHQALGKTELALGEFAAAREHLHNAVNIDRQAWPYFFSWALTGLGTAERVRANLQAANDHGRQALDIARRLGSGWMQAGAQRLLARLALAAGNISHAERYAHDALTRLQTKGFALDIPECLDILAAIAADQQNYDKAARLLGAATASRQRLGIVRFPPEPEFWASIERTTQDALGHSGYHTAYTQGTILSTEETHR